MPGTSEKILKELNTGKRALEEMDRFGLYASGNKVAEKAEILFARLDPKEVEKKLNAEAEAAAAAAAKTEAPAAAPGAAKKEGAADAAGAAEEAAGEQVTVPAKPIVDFDAFEKCEFRVCEVLSCEALPKSKKLLKFRLKCGASEIQILSGIKKFYPEPEKLVGKRVMAIVNLAPRKIAGEESQGMLLSALDETGKLCLMTTMDETIAAGAEVC